MIVLGKIWGLMWRRTRESLSQSLDILAKYAPSLRTRDGKAQHRELPKTKDSTLVKKNPQVCCVTSRNFSSAGTIITPRRKVGGTSLLLKKRDVAYRRVNMRFKTFTFMA